MKLDTIKITLILAEQGLTKTDLAEKCGISRQNISTIMRRGTCAIPTGGKLAKGLGVSIRDIIKEE